MTRLTAMIIQDSAVLCEPIGPDESGKYGGLIRKDVDRWRPLLSTKAVFDSPSAAVEHMESIVEKIRSTDLS